MLTRIKLYILYARYFFLYKFLYTLYSGCFNNVPFTGIPVIQGTSQTPSKKMFILKIQIDKIFMKFTITFETFILTQKIGAKHFLGMWTD